jgi:hypothetical protein
VEDGPFELRAEELKLEQGFLHVVFEQSSFVPQTFHLPPAVPPPPVCADYFHLATPELSEADSDDFALVESFEACAQAGG